MFAVITVIDCDEAYSQGGKQLRDIPAAINVVSAEPRKVFDNYAVDLARLYGGHHLLKMGTVKICSGVTVIVTLHHQLEFRAPGHIVVDEVALVPAISVAIKKFHEKTS